MSAIVIEVVDETHVRVCTINRVERRNAFDQQHYHALADSLADAASDAAVHVVVVTGTGSAFSAGQDLQELTALASGGSSGRSGGGQGSDGFPRLLEQLETFPKPLLAAVNGDAVGIGMTMLLHCDIVIVAAEARLRMPFSEMGVPPEAGSSALLPDAVGWQNAAELLFTSRWIDGTEAVMLGFAQRALPTDRVLADTLALAHRIAQRSPWAVQTAKRLLLAARGDRSRQARRGEDAAFVELFAGRSGA